tara:strand:- start:975 stop:1268 length:294 start_codon:yes stop_codon:yes gene_type:complete
MKINNIESNNNLIKCPKCFLINIDENGIKDICDHLVFVGTSHTDEPELDKEDIISKYDEDRFDDVVEYLKSELDDNYSMLIDSSIRQIDAYFVYKNI